MRRVVVTGLGAITPLGVTIEHTWRTLLRSKSGIVSTPKSPQYYALPSRVAGLVPTALDRPSAEGKISSNAVGKQSGLWNPDDWLNLGEQRRMAKYTHYAIACAQMAMDDAKWHPEPGSVGAEETGVCIGSGIGNFEEVYNSSVAYHEGGYKRISPLFVPKLLLNLAAGHISLQHGLLGPLTTPSTACTTGAHALGDAARLIAHGSATVMLAGGSESCIHPLAIAGFSRARSLSTQHNDEPELASRPWDTNRDGFVIAEGAGVIVLEDREHAIARGAKIYAELKGYGLSADAFHITAPRSDGAGALLSMKRALKDAGIKPRDVDYINAHATSTSIGDAAEAAAISTLMLGPEGVEKAEDVTVSSTKGATGHLLGAAGALEAIFCIKAIYEGVVPPTLNLETPSSDLPAFNYVPQVKQERNVDVALSNSFGFGGTNASLVFVNNGYADDK